MDDGKAVTALAALGQPARLAIFRLLVRAGPQGLAAGAIADAMAMLPSTLSNHLALLAQAGLAAGRREGRSIIYSICFDEVAALLTYLADDCCEGRPEVCGILPRTARAADP